MGRPGAFASPPLTAPLPTSDRRRTPGTPSPVEQQLGQSWWRDKVPRAWLVVPLWVGFCWDLLRGWVSLSTITQVRDSDLRILDNNPILPWNQLGESSINSKEEQSRCRMRGSSRKCSINCDTSAPRDHKPLLAYYIQNLHIIIQTDSFCRLFR